MAFPEEHLGEVYPQRFGSAGPKSSDLATLRHPGGSDRQMSLEPRLLQAVQP